MRDAIKDIELARSLLEQRKTFADDVVMETSGKQNQYSRFSAPLCDTKGDNIPGLSLRFETNRTQGFMKHRLGLMWRQGLITYQILDICIYPNTIRSHTDRSARIVIYGSHIHTINDVYKLDIDYDSVNWSDCFDLFKEKSNTEFLSLEIVGAFEGDLI